MTLSATLSATLATALPTPLPAIYQMSGLLTFTIAIVVFFAGAGLNRLITPLRQWNIPEAVTGGMLAALVTFAINNFFGVAINFQLEARDLLLLYFFTGIGLNARLSDLAAGGRPLLVLLAITLAYLVIQNFVAAGSVAMLGLPEGLTVMLGSVSLIGGHGTTIAWAPVVSERFNLPSSMEVGIASATLGLIIASFVGGPVAGLLIRRYKLKGDIGEAPVIGLDHENKKTRKHQINHINLLATILTLNVAILIGLILDRLLADRGINLPPFVICLMVAIILTNTMPRFFPNLHWPTRTPALALVSDLSLNVFLAMSLMSMQLWALNGLGLALITVLAIQTIVAVAYMLFVVFPAMGRNYQAAVISAGFSGISLGATPTAIANMTAVTKEHGPAPMAFLILPLVSAFFIDIANAIVIGLFVN